MPHKSLMIALVLISSLLFATDESKDVTRVYAELRSKAAPERARVFVQLSPEMKAAVWTHHLATALAEHSEFTNEQRSILQDTLTLLSPAFFAIDESSKDWPEVVDKPLQQLSGRAKAAFDPKLARELFAQLGPDEAQDSSSGKPRRLGEPVATDTPTCECSIFSDFCDNSGIGVYYCSQIGGCYFRTSGCGLLWQYACNGMCVMRPL